MTSINTAPVFHKATPLGKATIDIGSNDEGHSVSVQGDKILIAGMTNGGGGTDFSVIRLNAGGALDTTFGTDGKTLIDVGGHDDSAYTMMVQSGEKILIAGNSTNVDGFSDFGITRLNSDGTLDTSFSIDGKATFDINGGHDYGYALSVQTNGKILVAGTTTTQNLITGAVTSDFSIIRLNTGGALDTTFSTDGKATFDMGGSDQGRSLSLQTDGKILLAGSSHSIDSVTGATTDSFSVIRLNTDGTLDVTFSTDGKALISTGGYGDFAYSVKAQADNKILVAGYSIDSNNNSNFGVIRLSADGTLDTTFGTGGKTVCDITGFDDTATAMAVQSDGKILVAGYSVTGDSAYDFSVIRLTANGALDTTFGTDGKATFDIDGNDKAYDLTLQADGKILITGTSNNRDLGTYDFSVIRLNTDGTLDTTFSSASSTGGSTLGDSVNYTLGSQAVTLDTSVVVYDAELAALGAGAGNYSGASITLSREGGASSQDVFSGQDSLSLLGGVATLGGIAVGSVSNTGGTLRITFNASATQTVVNQTLSSIGYTNSSNAPPSSVQIQWLFNDGSSDGALTVADSSTVNITDSNAMVSITGTAMQGETLLADISALTDPNGVVTVLYQWQANGANIAGATSGSLTLAQDQVGQTISVLANYTDGQGNAGSVSSNPSAAVINANDAPTGSVTLSGTATQGQTLTAANTLADIDVPGTISYQWNADGVAISGATASTLVLGQDQVGKAITATASYTDGQGTDESKTSAASEAVVNVNDAPTGTISLSGTATQGQTLTATDTLADLDVLGAISYQWKAGGINIAGATTGTLTLAQAQVGKTITVQASYTDAQGHAESVSSSPSLTVTNTNDAPTGNVTFSGTATQGQTLTAANTLADLDVLGTISYQWKAGNAIISGATASTLVLAQAQVGKTITVQASYTDGQGHAESVSSSASLTVTNTNDAPTGSVTFSGTAKQGQTLTAANTLADLDVLGTISYQWKAGNAIISGATASTLVLAQAQVGKTITVQASYTDGQGHAESVSSSPSLTVNNTNDAPTGSVTFSGTATQGQTLTAANTLADIDVLGAISYQWKASGINIAGATTGTLTLAQAQVGKAITVTASYTDGQGTVETKTSAASAAIVNTNDAPTGSVTFSGTAKQGQTLTAANTLADLDVLGTISYQWKAGGINIAGATTGTLTLAQAQVGKAITVTASYTDGQGTTEAKTSAASAAVIVLDTTAPTVSSFSPADETTGVLPASNIVLTFSEAVTKGAGSVVLKTAAGAVIATYAVATSTNLTLSSDKTTLTLNPGSDLAFSTAYKVELAAGTFKDLAGNSYAGTTSYNFSTVGTTYTGTPGANKLTGGVGNDTLNALAGNDTLDGGAGNDSLSGGDGSDIYYVTNAGDKVIETNAVASTGGTDLVYSTLATYALTSYVENARINTTAAANLTGNTLANTLYAGAGNNVLDGGAGIDTVSYQYATAGITASLASTAAQATGGSGSDTLRNTENLTGSAYADKLTGSTANNALSGGAGNDALTGGAGNDTLDGGTGADSLSGGDGSDIYYVDNVGDKVIETNAVASTGGTDLIYSTLATYALTSYVENARINTTAAANLTGNTLANTLYAGAGNNVLDGGAGIDTVSYQYATAGITASLAVTTAQATGGSGSDTLRNTENLIGSAYADKLTGSTASNALSGGAGNDALDGGAGNDSLSGGDGNDILTGGLGVDHLTGGAGNDIFDFNALADSGITSATRDVITDFVRGQDKIDLSTLDANTALTGNQAFSAPVVGGTFSGAFANVGDLYFDNMAHVLYGNTDGDAAAEFAIALTGVTTLSSANLVL